MKHLLTKVVCALLIVNMLTISAPAAPAVVVGSVGELAQDVRFGFLSGKLTAYLPTFLGVFVRGARADNNDQISRIKIYPGAVTVRKGERIVFSAVAFDANDEPISGVDFEWRMTDLLNQFPTRKIPGGIFKSNIVGTFTVEAKSRGRKAEAVIIVRPSLMQTATQTTQTAQNKADSTEEAIQPEDSSEQPAAGTDNNQENKNSEEASTEQLRLPDDGGWGDGNWQSADDPGNQTGNPAGSPADDGAGSGNFQLSAPIIALPGRGIDLTLNLNYNSRLWNKSFTQSNSTLTYDIDRGFPSPGWSLGFGKMMDLGLDGGGLLVDADGTRHPFTATPAGTPTNKWYYAHTTDGTFIDYTSYRDANGLAMSTVWMPNGTVIYYGARANAALYPTLIQDANGNRVNITYVNNQGPNIETVTDTMGRITSFIYDANGNLITVTAPRSRAYGGSKVRVLARFHYRQLSLNYSFNGSITPVVRNGAPWVLDAVYYPATKTGYWFGDADSYSSYGMLTKVVEQRGMNWSASAEQQGIVTAGQMTKQALYNYPLTTANATGRTNGVNLSDAPTYDKLTESWAGMDDTAAETKYLFNNNVFHFDGASNSPARLVQITQPNGAISRQYSYRTPGAWTDGLVFADESFVMNGTTEVKVGSSLVSWQQGDYGTPRPSWTETYDENNHKVRTTYDYTGGRFNQVLRSCDYDNGNTKLRCTVTQYENDTRYVGYLSSGSYVGRHIYNLVKATGVENPDGTRASWTEYEYDNYQSQPLKSTVGVIQHDFTHDPYTTETRDGETCNVWGPTYPCGEPGQPMICKDCLEYQQVSAYNPNTEARGNITKVTNYADAANSSGAIYETRGYDVTGNLVTASTACCQQKSFDYTSATQFAYPESQTNGAAAVNSPDRITTSAVYMYEYGLVTQATDANGRISNTQYNPDTLRPTVSYSPSGAATTFVYDDAAMTVTEEVRESAGGIIGAKSVKYLNGVGQVKKEESLGANNIWDYAETKYNKLGQVWKQSRPYRAGDTVQWSETIYDNQGRTKKVIEPDGSYSEAFYNEAQRPDSATANVPGNTMRVADAWGRERWGRYDQQNRLVEVVEPKADGNGSVLTANSLVTKYQYDTLGRLIQTEQGVQQRKFKYDSLGRLTRQKLAEQTATLNDAGAFVGAGAQWSEAFVYDTRSNLTQKTDARGVRTNYAYYNLTTGAEDPLNRIQATIYDTSGPLEPNQTIHAAFNVTYEYMTAGDKTRIKKVETPGLMKEEYLYDTEGRVSDYTQTIAYRESYPMTTSYLYDTLSRVKEVRYPAQYGMTANPRRLVEHSYDTASRLTSLKINGTEQAGQIDYNAADQTKSIKIGAAGINQVTETYTFDPQTGLLTNQTAQKSGQTLLDLSYEYDRKNSVGTKNGKTGHLSKIVDNLNANKNREYEYDALGRLTKAKGGNSLWTQQYGYDRYGNRGTVTASGVAANGSPMIRDGFTNVSYDTNSNRVNTSGFQYDAAGNQTRALAEDGVNWLRYEYDAANRLRVVKRDDGTYLQAYTYGSSNARVFGYDYAINYLTLFATNGGTTLSEYTENVANVPTWRKSYTYLGDSLLSTITPNGTNSEFTEYSHPDRLGTRIITNQQAGTNYEQTTLPFGTALNAESSITTNNKRFTSYDRSGATGLDYAVNRHYDSKQGRFTQVDPVGMQATNLTSPQTLNLYSYCGNNPVNYTDPSGLFFGSLFKWIGKIFKIIMIAVAITIAIVAFITMPSLAPVIGYKVFAKMFVMAGAMLAQALAPPKIGAVIGIVSGMIFSGPGVIVNFGAAADTADKVNKIAKWLKLLVASNFVGAVANSFGQTKAGPKTKQFCSEILPYINAAKSIFDDAWKKSNYKTANPMEQGGIVKLEAGGYLNDVQFPRIPNSVGYALDGFPEWAAKHTSPPRGSYARPQTILFWYHTHPFEKGDILFTASDGRNAIAGDQNYPSIGDRANSGALNLYGVGISSTSIFVFSAQGRRCKFSR